MSTRSHWVAASLAATLLSHALPVAARDPQPPSPLQRWTAEAQSSLQRALVEPRPLGRPSEPAGVVDVAFAVGEDGRATRVAVLHSSGFCSLDDRTLAAVRRIRTRSATPAELAGGRLAVARIFSAPGDRPLDGEGMRDMVERTAAKNGWATSDRVANRSCGPLLLVAAR